MSTQPSRLPLPSRSSLLATLALCASAAAVPLAASDTAHASLRAEASARAKGRGRAKPRRGVPQSARFRLVVAARAQYSWTQRLDERNGCHQQVESYNGSEAWSVRSRRPVDVTIERLADGDVRLEYDRGFGIEVGGSWERKVGGSWEKRPLSSPSCLGSQFEQGQPEKAGCGMKLPQQTANLMLGFGGAHLAVERPSNLPRRPFGTCLAWAPQRIGDIPEFHGDIAQAKVAPAQLLGLRTGRSRTLRGRLVAPRSSVGAGIETGGSYEWEATLTRLR